MGTAFPAMIDCGSGVFDSRMILPAGKVGNAAAPTSSYADGTYSRGLASVFTNRRKTTLSVEVGETAFREATPLTDHAIRGTL